MGFLSESSAMVTCFYAGMYTIQFRNVITNNDLVVFVILPIVIMCTLMTPSLLVIYSMVSCITHPNSELIGEVMDFMSGTDEMRTTLMDTLFPDMDDSLMEKVSIDDV